MGIGYQQTIDKILFLDARRRLAFAAATLRFVIRERLIFDVTLMRQRHDHIFLIDQIFDVDIGAVGGDLGAAFVAELVAHGDQLFPDHFHQTLSVHQDIEQFSDLLQQLFVLVEQLFMLKSGELLQTQIEDRLRLLFGQVVATVADTELFVQPFRTRGVIARTFQHGGDVAQIPRLRDQARFRLGRVRRAANEFDNRIDVGQRDRQTFKDMRAVTRFAQFENGTARDDFATMTHKGFEDLLQRHDLRLALMQRHHVDAERDLQLRQRVEIVQHHFADGIALHFDHDAHTVFIGLVAQRADAFDALLFHQLGDFLNQARFVDLIRDLVHHDGFAAGFGVGFHLAARADIDFAAPGAVRLFNAAAAVDNGRSREVGTRDVLHQPFDADIFIVDIGETAVDHFRQVVRRNIGRHPYGDAG